MHIIALKSSHPPVAIFTDGQYDTSNGGTISFVTSLTVDLNVTNSIAVWKLSNTKALTAGAKFSMKDLRKMKLGVTCGYSDHC